MIKQSFFLVLFSCFSLFAQNIPLKTTIHWQNLDYKTDGFYGISTNKAYEYLKDRKTSTVTVAIIDSGVEVDHPDLAGKIWVNTNEIPNNGIDDDKNGYVDDINGWDFLGNKNGEDITYETLELVREMRRLEKEIVDIDPLKASTSEKKKIEEYKSLKARVEKKRKDLVQQGGDYYLQIYEAFKNAKKVIEQNFGKGEITKQTLSKIGLVSSPELQEAKKIYELLFEMGMTEDDLVEAYKYFYGNLNYNLNADFDPRPTIGDNVLDFADNNYGNNEVEGPDAEHGTHVAGIVAGIRSNETGADGIANDVKLMVLRTVPDGDERDKDVALAIRYAADNGAKVINMSFGKALSPNKDVVDAAVKYAEQKGVLMVHAAGNDGLNLDMESNYPNQKYIDGGKCKSWIEVGASSWHIDEKLVAGFSNYGKKSVDVFAPGVDIYSSITNYAAKENSGTSMAAPVVTGLAALILSYFPALNALQVKDIILKSAIAMPSKKVTLPESTDKVSFGELSNTAAIVNALEAIKMAEGYKLK